MKEFDPGCQRPSGQTKPIVEATDTSGIEKGERQNMIRVGKPAPDFTLPAFHKGKFGEITLADYRGKWVMLCFYPGDFTFVWATEVSAVAEKYPEFEELGVEVFSISVDSVFVHKIWNDNEISKMVNKDVPFAMLSDQNGNVGRMYGVYNEEAGVQDRGRFIIDPNGIIQAYEVMTPPVGRNVQETLRQIKAFQLVHETKGAEVTPAGWKPGKKVLKPGPDLVGNVWKVWNVKEAFED